MSTPEIILTAAPDRPRIQTSPWHFFTPAMWMILAAVGGVVYWAQHMVLEIFFHHIELNGIIVALTVYGIFRVFENNYHLWRTALYIRGIERVEESPSPDTAQVARLLQQVKNGGALLDTQNTGFALQRMAQVGLFVISDNDSRLIKSKIGSRVRYRYNHISFFAGILISFGLLGTFVGLIQTVASVGEQMGVVSASLAAGKELSVIELITGISKPLQGMGTAFGASLFGLAGSMLLGGLNYLGGHAQDDFMENLSRWLDDHIPHSKHDTAQKVKSLTGPASTHQPAPQPANIAGVDMPRPVANPSGLSMDMGTFMVLAEDTHKQLRSLGGLLAEISAALKAQQQATQALQQLQNQSSKDMHELYTQLAALPATNTKVVESLGEWQKGFSSALGAQSRSMEQLQQIMAAGQEKLGITLTQTLDKAFEGQARELARIGAQSTGGLFGMFGKKKD